MENNGEERINEFLDELLSEKAPNYSILEKDRNLIEMVEISLLLKEKIRKNEHFKAELFDKLNFEFEKENVKKEERNSKSVLFNVLSVGISLSIIALILNPFAFYSHKKPYGSSVRNQLKQIRMKYNSKTDIIKVTSYRFSNGKTLRLLYNERNNVILYWPFGQLAIFQ